MKLLFFCLIALGIAAFVALGIREDSGYVLIGYDVWTFESSLALFVLALVIVFVTLYITLRTIDNLLSAPEKMRSWGSRLSAKRARKALNRGLLELSEGDWKKAEKHLLRLANHSETPMLNYLAAARSAQQQQAYDRRDHYLRLAHACMPAADVAVGLTQAELQMDHEQLEQALATLQHLRSIAPHHTQVLKLLKKLYEQLGDWKGLRDLLPELRKRNVIGEDELETLEISIYKALLGQAASDDDPAKLRQSWERIPRKLQTHEELVVCYAQHLMERGRNDQAQEIVFNAMRKQWSEMLIELYGQIKSSNPSKQLSAAEGWLSRKADDAVLLLTLGRLCLRCKLWGKARSYLESSLAICASSTTYRELGALLEQLEEPIKAMECYRAGLELHVKDITLDLPPPAEAGNGEEAETEEATPQLEQKSA